MNNPSVQELKARLPGCMIRDRFRFRKEIDKGRTGGRLIGRIAGSVSLAESRQNRIPRVNYPEALPISARVGDIVTAIKHNQVVIIAGETGSGKTTQIPKICLDAGLGVSPGKLSRSTAIKHNQVVIIPGKPPRYPKSAGCGSGCLWHDRSHSAKTTGDAYCLQTNC